MKDKKKRLTFVTCETHSSSCCGLGELGTIMLLTICCIYFILFFFFFFFGGGGGGGGGGILFSIWGLIVIS